MSFAKTIDSLFDRLGKEAVYTSGASNVSIKVIQRQPDEVMDIARSRIHTETHLFDVRVADVSLPKAGDSILIASTSFVVQGEPTKDMHKLLWHLEAYAT